MSFQSRPLPKFPVIQREFQRVSETQRGPHNYIILDELHAEPDKPRKGMLVFADGVDWNPGKGKGFYAYFCGTWNQFLTDNHYITVPQGNLSLSTTAPTVA